MHVSYAAREHMLEMVRAIGRENASLLKALADRRRSNFSNQDMTAFYDDAILIGRSRNRPSHRLLAAFADAIILLRAHA